MRKTSEILQVVIDSGVYGVDFHEGSTQYMCVAIKYSRHITGITEEEAYNAVEDIEEHLFHVYTRRKAEGVKFESEFFTPRSNIPTLGEIIGDVNEEGFVKVAPFEQRLKHYKKWIRDLKRRGN